MIDSNAIDFQSRAEKKKWEKTWDVLQTIKEHYFEKNSEPLLVPINYLTITGRKYSEVEGILDWLKSEKIFKKYWRGNPNYGFTGVNSKLFEEIYLEIKNIYEKFAKKEKQKNFYAAKCKIFINRESGIYRFNDNQKKLAYPIKGSKRPKIIELLCQNNILEAQKFQIVHSNISLLSKEIKEINSLFRKKLNLVGDLIVHVDTGGYKLNKDKFEIYCKL